jgi:hypothetical protein
MTQVTQFSLLNGQVVFVEAAEKTSVSGQQRAAAIETIGKYLKGEPAADKIPSLADGVDPIIESGAGKAGPIG